MRLRWWAASTLSRVGDEELSDLIKTREQAILLRYRFSCARLYSLSRVPCSWMDAIKQSMLWWCFVLYSLVLLAYINNTFVALGNCTSNTVLIAVATTHPQLLMFHFFFLSFFLLHLRFIRFYFFALRHGLLLLLLFYYYLPTIYIHTYVYEY